MLLASITIDGKALLDSALVGLAASIGLVLFFSVAVLAADRARANSNSELRHTVGLLWWGIAAAGLALSLAISVAGIWAMTQK
jgi:hypothetical protein